MFHVNWVCFDCRKARRYPGERKPGWRLSGELPHCPQCGLPMTSIPPAGKLKRWQTLRQAYLSPQSWRGVEILKENQMRNFMSLVDLRDSTGKAARRQYRRAQKLQQDLASRKAHPD